MTEIQENGVYKFYKKLGETPRECILRYKDENPTLRAVPMTYAGRLDPMAEGLLLALSEPVINEKEKYLDLPKVYRFEILWEFETDTLDILGVAGHDDISIFPTEADVQKNIAASAGKFEQVYPAFSSQPVDGKPLIQWAREGRIGEIKIPSHEVEIFKAEYLGRRFENGKNLFDEIKSKISLVVGDFRQEKILNEWKKILEKRESNQYAIDKAELRVSGGFYVRQFVSDLAKSLGTKGLTYHILRTEIGDYKI